MVLPPTSGCAACFFGNFNFTRSVYHSVSLRARPGGGGWGGRGFYMGVRWGSGHRFCGRGRTPPLRMTGKLVQPGRCGERIERCQWQKKRDERVAAVKISSVRRKAAQKFWAPQQDHRPLRMQGKGCGAGDYGLPRARCALAMTGFWQGARSAAGHMGPALQGFF